MTGNPHFGNIGDVWKHLLLCAVLDAERPDQVWESHAGAWRYGVDEAAERRFGVVRYLRRATDVAALDSARYTELLDEVNEDRADPETYLGSPALAVRLLGTDAEYFFFDIDADCLDAIAEGAAALGCSSAVNVVRADGLAGVAACVEAGGVEDAVVLVDPFSLPTSRDTSPFELFGDVVACGAVALLWYGFQSGDAVDRRFGRVRDEVGDRVPSPGDLWCGELLTADADGPGDRHGLVGSHLLCGGLSRGTERRCVELGEAVAAAYGGPTANHRGLEFSVRSI